MGKLASELARRIHLNSAFCDTWKDLKPWYNVQTSHEAFVYFNYFVHHASVNEITNALVKAAEEAFASCLSAMHDSMAAFGRKSGQTLCDLSNRTAYGTKLQNHFSLY